MGEALATGNQNDNDRVSHPDLLGSSCEQNPWHVIWCRNNCEKIVYKELVKKGYEVFLPIVYERSAVKNSKKIITVPMFRGYLFIRHKIDKYAYVDICKTDGLVKLLGMRWDRLARVSDEEIRSIRLLSQSQLPAMPYPFIKKGDRVRVRNGSLANTEGILVKSDNSKGLFVVSINLLRRSMAIELHPADVELI